MKDNIVQLVQFKKSVGIVEATLPSLGLTDIEAMPPSLRLIGTVGSASCTEIERQRSLGLRGRESMTTSLGLSCTETTPPSLTLTHTEATTPSLKLTYSEATPSSLKLTH